MGNKLALRWRGLRRILKAVSDYVFTVEYFFNGSVSDFHSSRLKFYREQSLDGKVTMSHFLTSETVMLVSMFLRLENTSDGFMVTVRWKCMDSSEDTLEPLEQVYENVPDILGKLLKRKNTTPDLSDRARRHLSP